MTQARVHDSIEEQIVAMVRTQPRQLLYTDVVQRLVKQGLKQHSAEYEVRKAEEYGAIVHVPGKGYIPNVA